MICVNHTTGNRRGGDGTNTAETTDLGGEMRAIQSRWKEIHHRADIDGAIIQTRSIMITIFIIDRPRTIDCMAEPSVVTREGLVRTPGAPLHEGATVLTVILTVIDDDGSILLHRVEHALDRRARREASGGGIWMKTTISDHAGIRTMV